MIINKTKEKIKIKILNLEKKFYLTLLFTRGFFSYVT